MKNLKDWIGKYCVVYLDEPIGTLENKMLCGKLLEVWEDGLLLALHGTQYAIFWRTIHVIMLPADQTAIEVEAIALKQ